MKRCAFATVAAFAVALAAAPAAAVNLVYNGSFEIGYFDGWTHFGDTSWTFVSMSFSVPPTDGLIQAVFGPHYPGGGIKQTIAGPAGKYTVSFDMQNRLGQSNSVRFGNQTILSNIPDTNGNWNSYSFSVITGANPVLSFEFLNPLQFYRLDNVSVSYAGAAPEPQSWALLVAGFGLIGAVSRRRRARTPASLSNRG